MRNTDPFSPREDQPSTLSGIRVSKETVEADPFTRALLSGETQVREARARACANLGNISCRDCPLFNNQIDPFAWARNGKNIPPHIVRAYTRDYIKRLEAAESGECSGLVTRREPLVVEQVSVVVEKEDDPALKGQILGYAEVQRCGIDEQCVPPLSSISRLCE